MAVLDLKHTADREHDLAAVEGHMVSALIHHHVATVSGRLILKALVAGERDPEVLAEMAMRRLRSKIPQPREALRGAPRSSSGCR